MKSQSRSNGKYFIHSTPSSGTFKPQKLVWTLNKLCHYFLAYWYKDSFKNKKLFMAIFIKNWLNYGNIKHRECFFSRGKSSESILFLHNFENQYV